MQTAKSKKYIGLNVLGAAKERIATVFNEFPVIYASFSGGKDSSAMVHLILDEAKKRARKVGLLFVDLEAQYKLSIEFIKLIYEKYKDNVDPFWCSLPLSLRNAVSQFEPKWLCWDKNKKDMWIREPDEISITDIDYFPFFKVGMEFEDFVPAFGDWYSKGKLCACFVGIRSDESLNRYRTIAKKKKTYLGNQWTTHVVGSVYNIYPIYDWRTQDIWIYHGKYKKEYNRLYDRMHMAGLSINQARICQPYGDDQRKGLWLYHIIEPETWGRIVARVNGANQGALYSAESGNILGQRKINKPAHLSWEEFASFLLESMPENTREHFKNKIAVFLHWYKMKAPEYQFGIPDEGPMNDKNSPSWVRICKCLLRNDYWCKGLSFGQHRTNSYEKYVKLMKKRRAQWMIY